MTNMENGDSVPLFDYKDSNSGKRRRKKPADPDSLELFSDSVPERNRDHKDRGLEKSTAFSDTCDVNLPSVRAQIAASQRHQESMRASYRVHKETTPLLDDSNSSENSVKYGESMAIAEDNNKQQPPPYSNRKADKWVRMKKW